MSAVSDILKQVTIPKMVRVKQSFPRPRIEGREGRRAGGA